MSAPGVTAKGSTAPVITALGLATPLGLGREEFVTAWQAGLSAESAEGLPGPRLGKLPLARLFPGHRGAMRRMDRLSKLVCAAAGLAAEDGPGLGERDALALGVGTDVGTLEETWAFLARLRDKGPEFANPASFPNLVPNAGAGYAGIFLGLRGPSHTFCQHGTCGDDAVAWGEAGVRAGRFDAALVGGAEELAPGRAAALERSGGEVLGRRPGEGGAMVLLETPARAAARGATPLATLLASVGATSAAGRSPLVLDIERAAVADLVRAALDRAGVPAWHVGVVLGSQDSGVDERSALRAGVSDVTGPSVPWTDHASRLGVHPADGAFRVALAALLLADSTLPVHADGRRRTGDVALVVSAARGGSLRVTVLGAAERGDERGRERSKGSRL